MSKNNTWLLLTGLLLILSSMSLTGQNLNQLKTKYPGYNELVIKEMQSYKFSIKNDRPVITQDNYYESMILSDFGIHNSSESFTFSDLVPLKSYDAYTVINDAGKDKKIPIQQVTENVAAQRSVFHSDVKEKKLVYSNLSIGARKVYSYQSEFLDPYLLHRFMFAGNLPIEEAVFEIEADKGVEIGYKVINDPNHEITHTIHTKKSKTIYKWTRALGKAIKYENNTPGFLHIAPHIVVYLKSYKANKNIVSVLGDPSLLHKYYQNFVNNINKGEDENLKKIAVELTEHLSSDEEKIKSIFYWVKDHIKYVAFESGYEGFVPREAKLVNERRFGDCKDMSSIITTMARYAHIPHVNLCWIGSRNIPYSYHDVATPAADDHMIASIDIDGKTVFLDATDKESPYGLPTGFIQGKEAMINQGDTFRIVKVPVVDPADNLNEYKVHISTDNNLIKGKGQLQLLGIARSNFLNNIGDVRTAKRFDVIKNLVNMGNNKFNLKDYKESNVTNRDLPYGVDFDFTLDNYMVQAGKETYLSLILIKPFEGNIIEKDREAKYEFDFLTQNKVSITMDIPEGKSVKNLPEDAAVDNRLIKYSITYRKQP
ncbi:MAG: DUF3857 domain-containing protein, partial [Saprospiraceae bacterium]